MVKLSDFVKVIEKVTGCEAIIENEGYQMGDALATHADISELVKKIKYEPKVVIQDGMQNVADWVRFYYFGKKG